MRSPLMAALLSLLVPGLGQLATGQRAKGVAILCMTAGMWLGLAATDSAIGRLLVGCIYLAILIPAVQDAYLAATGVASPLTDARPWYVIWMLLIVGPFALPLLWQSRRFSTRAKWGWTTAIILVALLGIAAAAALGPVLDQLLEQYRNLR